MTYGSLFTGGGLACWGARAAGLELAWGVELEAKTAEVANANLGGHVLTANVLDINPRRLEPVDAFAVPDAKCARIRVSERC